MRGSKKREPLSRERVLDAALAIADRDGLAALSMRRVGEALGVEAMSLYNHVANKAAILDGLYERVLGAPPARRPGVAWQDELRAHALHLRDALRAHPNLISLFATRGAATPAAVAHIEHMLGIAVSAGLEPADALAACQVFYTFIVGHTLFSYGPRGADDGSGLDERVLEGGAFPLLQQAVSTSTYDVEDELELGLEALLGGLEARARPKRR